MRDYIMNCKHLVNWNSVIAELKDGIDILPIKENWNTDNKDYLAIFKMWEEANFNMSAIKWTNYYPVKHFSQDVVDSVCDYIGVKEHRAWISKIDPGYYAPWHWDVDDNEVAYLEKGPIHRYSGHISIAHPGHAFVVGNEIHHMWEQGDIVKWQNHNEWHTGMNGGTTPKYLFNLVAYF